MGDLSTTKPLKRRMVGSRYQSTMHINDLSINAAGFASGLLRVD